MYRVILFAGTSEGRILAEFLSENRIDSLVCTATEYGGSLISEGEFIKVSDERMDRDAMTALFTAEKPELVIDATHPYAKDVTSNISSACDEAGTEYLRVLRQGLYDGDTSSCVHVSSIDEAVEYLKDKEGKILATTGSKEIAAYTGLDNYRERVIARVLSTEESIRLCREAGFEGGNLICMQGPFSRELNSAMLKQYDCRYLVTKASGRSGGFEDKLMAAADCGATAIVIGVPEQRQGLDIYQCMRKLGEKFGFRPAQKVSLVGIGTGSSALMTGEAAKAIDEAQLLIGAGRMLEAAAAQGKATLKEYNAQKISDYIKANWQYRNIAVLLSGDSGFYSGARKLVPILEEAGCQVQQLPGISSVSYFMARIRHSWDDAVIVSNHGLGTSLIPLIRDNRKVFSILGKRDDIATLAGKLCEYGLDDVTIHVGEKLSYEDEKITSGRPDEFTEYENDPLCVVCVINDRWQETEINRMTCRRDDEFIRGKVPMTKEEIRTISVDRLGICEDSVCYDVGAGTGSVSIEMAIKASKGSVYAIEKKAEAVELININKKKFMTDNLTVIEGFAPEAMEGLPAPTHVFIGGSSGNMDEIISCALAANPQARVVINCIAIESIAQAVACSRKYSDSEPEIMQLQASRGRKVGGYTLMNGENPIAIIAFGGKNK